MNWLPISELDPILKNDAVTRGLPDPEAQLLVKWLVFQSENLSRADAARRNTAANIHRLCLRAKAIKRFIILYCHHRNVGAAYQLAASMKFTWPLPSRRIDAYDLLQEILDWETECFLESADIP